MQAGSEKVDGDDGGSGELVIRIEWLAEHHLVSLE
jgi:hypothetical protein